MDLLEKAITFLQDRSCNQEVGVIVFPSESRKDSFVKKLYSSIKDVDLPIRTRNRCVNSCGDRLFFITDTERSCYALRGLYISKILNLSDVTNRRLSIELRLRSKR